jgi:hypothetical protein
MMLLVGSAAALHNPLTEVGQPGVKVIDGKYALIEPTEWIGERLPLLGRLDVGNVIAEGTWNVLLYSDSCSLCRDALQRLDRSTPFPPLALIELPPFGDSRHEPAHNHLRARLQSNYAWVLEGPVTLRLVDGVVVDVLHDTENRGKSE